VIRRIQTDTASLPTRLGSSDKHTPACHTALILVPFKASWLLYVSPRKTFCPHSTRVPFSSHKWPPYSPNGISNSNRLCFLWGKGWNLCTHNVHILIFSAKVRIEYRASSYEVCEEATLGQGWSEYFASPLSVLLQQCNTPGVHKFSQNLATTTKF
jgi:hypothetical protein